jgi:L-iditol 2-dehydrogenase
VRNSQQHQQQQQANMSTTETATTLKPTMENIGVFTNPAHDLWVAETSPTRAEVENGEALKEGEVTIAVKSTGICG